MIRRLIVVSLVILLTCYGATPFGLSLTAPSPRMIGVGMETPYGVSASGTSWGFQYATWALAMPSALKTSLLTAGVNTIRLYVDPQPLATAANDAAVISLLTSGPFVAITDLLASGFKKVIFDFHWQPSPSLTPGWGASDVIAITSTADTKFAQMVHVATVVAQQLVANYGDNVLFELFNEPPVAAAFTGVTWASQLQFYVNAVRAVAPTLKLIVSNMDLGDTGTFLSFNLSSYASDPNIFFSFHDYQPGAFTPQGGIGGQGAGASYAQYLAVQFPPGTGGETRTGTEATAAALVNADTSTSSGQKSSFITTINLLIDAYFNTPQNVAWLQARFAAAAAHTDAAGIPRYRLFKGENGSVGVQTSDNTRNYISPAGGGGAPLASRVTYYSAIGSELLALGISGSIHTIEKKDAYSIVSGTNLVPEIAAVAFQ